MALLEVADLRVTYPSPPGEVAVVDGVSFALDAGAALGLVGESGSGKSQAVLALMGLNGPAARVAGSIRFDGVERCGAPAAQWRQLRGAHIGMVFQDPMTALNPYLTVGTQLAEPLLLHRGASRRDALAEAARMLDAVRVPDARRRLAQYPHELSGGLRQRVLIAGALVCRPRLLIADEPTTALDATVQAQLLDLLDELRHSMGLALLLVSHDPAVIGRACDRALVLYAGREMESGPSAALLQHPAHPYTQALLRARPGTHVVPRSVLAAIPGAPPDPRLRAPGCPFEPRCAYVETACAQARPALAEFAPGRRQACVRTT